MSHITLIRHGQANSMARDEESYDRLSDLGHQQAAWLGAHLDASRARHPRVYCGTLRRHVETVTSMGLGDVAVRDQRLNELAYFTIAALFEAQHGAPMPTAREDFARHLPRVFGAWERGEIEGVPESFVAFEERVAAALAEIAAGEGPALVVTSGGLIAMTMRQSLGLDLPAMARMALGIFNTSVHRLHPIGDRLTPVLFNAVPHLDPPDRHYALTHM